MLKSIFHLFSDNKRVEASRNKLFQAAYSWTHDPALSEDLAQETLLKALSSRAQLKKSQYLDTWLFRILLNNWHDYLKRRKQVESLDDYIFVSISDVENEYQCGELISRVRHEISKLPMPIREVITLSDFSGFSYQQIADIMAIPVGTVMSRLYRARRILEKNLLDIKPVERNGVTYLRNIR